jgi:hypothetical protein
VRALGFLLAFCALVAVGCGGGSMAEEAAPPVETTPAAPPTNANRPPAPAIEGESLDGERISLADLRGRAVFVNVWSSW